MAMVLSYLYAFAFSLLIALAPARSIAQSAPTQQKSPASKDPAEMIVTQEGFVAIDTPKGWVRSEGPGLAFFVHDGDNRATASTWIYMNSSPIGPNEDAKNFAEYIQSDVSAFKQRFEKGSVQDEGTLELPRVKSRAPIYLFRGSEEHNAFEEVVYIEENGRVLILVLDGKNASAFEKSKPDFLNFAKSYGGSIIMFENK
jgi:hypothetical protein